MNKKSTIAKLLSQEDIHVVHKKAQTASFDVKSRELVLPIFKQELSDDVYEMFVCHEVGHALYTPLSMLESIHHQKINHGVVNVIEDARIEKMFQNKYPGSRKSFEKGYKELIKKNFFGLKDKDLSTLNIIDKINIFYKTGMIGTTTPEELELINEVAKCKTPEDVISLAAKLCEYHKEHKDEEMPDGETKSDNQQSDGDEEQEQQQQESQSSEQQDENEDEQETTSATPSDDDEEEKEEVETTNTSSGPEGGKNAEGDLRSETDDAYSKAMKDGIDEKAKDRLYLNIPKSLKMSKITLSYKRIMEELNEDFTKRHHPDFDTAVKQEMDKIFNENKKVVQYMVKEFEMKKSADAYKRATVSKTGSLDMTKLHSYRYNEDLFAKITTIPGSTNHGMIMYLDWSGSMSGNMRFTLIQLYNLIWFCQRVKIPFQVLAFSDRYKHNTNDDHKEMQDEVLNDLTFGRFNLFEFFTNKMTKQETMWMMKELLAMTYSWGYSELYCTDGHYIRSTWIPSRFNLGGTPLNQAIITTYKMTKKFMSENKVQKLNLVYLTDGESHTHSEWWSPKIGDSDYLQPNGSYNVSSKDVYITCPETGASTIINGMYGQIQTEAYLKLLKKQLPNISVLGFFIAGSGKNGRVPLNVICKAYNLNQYEPANHEQIAKIQKQLSKDKVSVCKVAGYDEYYILPRGQKLEEKSDYEFKDNMKTAGMAREFLKHATKKTLNRQLLNKFIENIA